ncbi:hypothetical protein LSH36_827g00018 [Paralvinella palmiformis]|uniref:Uncharacterized protein n=1 Tax=Paralvinella palmiformis TaxID=53620 RepID=A0AAD9IZR4_9ANNE|nr:hypothetical protein LSH36_827g00018 [Paralvinella palmiformis]
MDDPVKPSGEDEAAEEVPQARVSKNTDHSLGTESGDGNNEDLGVGVGSWSGEMMTGKQKRVQKEDVDLPDPFDHHMNILLENNLDRTTSTTPASGLSSRSYSPTNDGSESQYPSAPVHFMRHLLPEVPANSPETCHGAAMMSQGKHQELPSFHNVEMVQKIREKKLSYNCGDEEISKEVSNYPYTPTNSYTEFGHIGQTAKHCVLPNFMNADLMQRLEEKKAMLENIVHPSEGFEIFESSGLNDGHSVPMSNVSDIKSSDVSDEISEDEDFSVDVFANREHLESLSKNTSETCCKDNSTDTGTAVEDVMNDVLNTEFVQNDTEPDHNNVISPVSHIQTSEEHLTGDIQSGLVTFGDCSEVGYNMEAGLHAELPPNNVLNTSLMMADSPKSAELNAPFEEDLSDKVGALSSHGNNNTSSSNPDDTGNSAEEKIVHHTVQDTTTMLEQVDCRKIGLVIHAANEQEAATKFTESVINSAMKEYKEYCKSVGKKQARFNEQEVNLSSSHHDSSKRETERCVSENCDNVLSLQIEKSLYLGDEPGESYTDDCVNIASDVLPHGVKPCEDQTCNDGHVLVLGEEPGESRTECDTFEEHMRSRGMDVVDIDVSDRLDANVGKSDDVPKDTVLENEKAMDFVQDVIKKAIDVCIHEPDGSTAPGSKSLFQSPDGSSDAPEMKTQPKGGSTGKAKLLEELKDDTMKQKKTRKEVRELYYF